MLWFRTGLSVALLTGVMIGCSSRVGAEDRESTIDVVAALQRLPERATELTFSGSGLQLPAGGHIQGIQFQYDGTNNRFLAFISHDSRTFAYVVVVAFDPSLTTPGEVLHVHRFTEGRLRHAGGIQLHDRTLVVGLEDNWSKDRAEVQFWNVADPADWQPLSHLTIGRSGAPKDQTAGAVAITTHNERTLVAVANWDSRDIDLYRSTQSDLALETCRFEPVARWSVETAETADWTPDEITGSFQAINLLSAADNQLYLVGFHEADGRRNLADAFQLDLSAQPPHLLHKLSSQQITLSSGNRFKYGGGLFLHRDELWLLATPRSFSDTVRLSLVR